MRKKALSPVFIGCVLAFCHPILAFNANIPPTTTEFELVKGLVIVQAKLDGQFGNFILDTGSSMMVLNEKTAATGVFQASNFSGEVAGNWKSIGIFDFSGVQKYGLKALGTDIAPLEIIVNRPLAGIIGYDFLAGFELMLDFERRLITLAPAGEMVKVEGLKLRAEMAFSLAGHLPVIEAKIGDLTLRFGLDTGANTNLLSKEKVSLLYPALANLNTGASILGMSGNSYETGAVDVFETMVGEEGFRNMRYLITDFSQLQNLTANGVDGLLGFPFFQSGKFSLNYANKTFSIWE